MKIADNKCIKNIANEEKSNPIFNAYYYTINQLTNNIPNKYTTIPYIEESKNIAKKDKTHLHESHEHINNKPTNGKEEQYDTLTDKKFILTSKLNLENKNITINDFLLEEKIYRQIIGTAIQESSSNNKMNPGISKYNYNKYEMTWNARLNYKHNK